MIQQARSGRAVAIQSFGCFRSPRTYHLTLFSTTPASNSGATRGNETMPTSPVLNVISRAQTGRSASRRLRKVNQIPAILYGKHSAPEKLAIDAPEFTRLLKVVAGRKLIIELQRKDNNDKALSFLQEVQRDPITDRFLHVDLQEVKADEKFEVEVPVALIGEAHGVKIQNGVLEIATHTVRVRCLPKDLPASIDVDVSDLKVNETIKVGNLKPIEGVEYRDPAGQPVVSCLEVAAEEVAATTPGAPAAAAPGAAPAAAPAAGAAAPAAGAKPAAGAAKPAAAPAKK
jgi:large subunit ribosomal protein L25